MVRLAAFDMDGTLLMPDHRTGDATLKTLRRLQERGVTLAFATVGICLICVLCCRK